MIFTKDGQLLSRMYNVFDGDVKHCMNIRVKFTDSAILSNRWEILKVNDSKDQFSLKWYMGREKAT